MASGSSRVNGRTSLKETSFTVNRQTVERIWDLLGKIAVRDLKGLSKIGELRDCIAMKVQCYYIHVTCPNPAHHMFCVQQHMVAEKNPYCTG